MRRIRIRHVHVWHDVTNRDVNSTAINYWTLYRCRCGETKAVALLNESSIHHLPEEFRKGRIVR